MTQAPVASLEQSRRVVRAAARPLDNAARPGARVPALLALQRLAGNGAVSALLAGKAKAGGEDAVKRIEAALVEARAGEPNLEILEKGLNESKAAGVPVDIDGAARKPPASALAVTKTGFGPGAVAEAKPARPPKKTPATSALAKASRPAAKIAAGAGATLAMGAGVKATPVPAPVAAGPLDVHAPPVPPTHVTPDEDPAFRAVTGAAAGFAAAKKSHPSAATKAKEAQDAAVAPSSDVQGQAQAAKVTTMDAQPAGSFDKKAFIAAVKTAIESKSPKTLQEADDYQGSGKAGQVKGEVKGLVGGNKERAAQAVEQATDAPPDPSTAVAKPVTPMTPEQAGPAAAIPAEGAAPKPAPAAQLNLEAGKREADSTMADADVSQEQLAKSNEPEFTGALAAKEQAAAHADTGPGQFREHEAQTLESTKASAAGQTSQAVAGIHGAKVTALGQVTGQKAATKSADETKRAEVTAKIQSIYSATESDVRKTLDGIDPKVDKAFEDGEKGARSQFESFVAAKMSAYKDDRYGGWLGGYRWVKDKLLGMPSAVNEFFEAGRELYLRAMDGVISRVADIVGADLAEAKGRIAAGKKEIAAYVASLPRDLRSVGAEAATAVGDQFDKLESDVTAKQDALVDSLASKYVEARKGLDERIEALQAENKGLVDAAIGAIKGVIETILKLKDMLLNVLARAAAAVTKIIKDPIGFLGNFVNAVKTGIQNFATNIWTHLKKGLQAWLFGALAEGGIALPEKFDLKGIVQLVLSILGLTYTRVRARIVAKIGEPAMAFVEKGFEVVKILVTQGLGGLWTWVLEKVGDIKEMVMSQVKEMVVTQIVKAGITWLISMLNPAGAFIKACKMIYDVVMFFVEKAAQIKEFVDAVLDSVESIAGGGVGAVASKIENTLAKMLPVLIGFLASLLGLGGIADKIKKIIETIQKPIAKVVDWVVGKAVAFGTKFLAGAKRLGGKLKAKLGIKDETPVQKQARLDRGMAAAREVGRRFAGKPVGKQVLGPLLAVVRLRHRMTSLELVEKSGHWAVRGTVNPTAEETLEAELADPKYEEQFAKAVAQANVRLAKEKPPRTIAAADLAEARRVVAPTGRRAAGSLAKWVQDLYTYFRDPNPEKVDTVATVASNGVAPGLVANLSQKFTRLAAQTLDTAQTELNEHYRPGATKGDKSSAYLVVAEQVAGGRGAPAVPIVAGTTHFDKCKRAVQLFRRLEPGLPPPQQAVLQRERSKMETALVWSIAYRDPAQAVRALPGFAADLGPRLAPPA